MREADTVAGGEGFLLSRCHRLIGTHCSGQLGRGLGIGLQHLGLAHGHLGP